MFDIRTKRWTALPNMPTAGLVMSTLDRTATTLWLLNSVGTFVSVDVAQITNSSAWRNYGYNWSANGGK